MEWDFEPSNQYGGYGGQGYRSEGRGTMPSSDLLVRESIQNSLDATHRAGGKLKMRFSETILEASAKESLLKSLMIEKNFASRAVLAEQSSQQKDEESIALWEQLWHPGQKLRTVFVEDFGGPGLRGKHINLQNQSSWWRTYVNYHGESDKGENSAVGGSHGKGKMALVSCSNIYSILIYSEVDASAEPTSDHSASLSGIIYLPKHWFEGSEFLGRGFLGTRTDQGVLPLTGDTARVLAKQIGFTRKPGEYGLSVAILECRATMEQIARAVEKHWWPALSHDNPLDVEVRDHRGMMHPLDFSKQRWITDYIEAHKAALGETPDSVTTKVKALPKFEGSLPLGKVAIKLLGDSSTTEEQDEEATLTNRLALVRGLGMVVKYSEPIQGQSFRGVFLASESVDGILRKAEPLAHDGWVPDTHGLTQTEQTVVKRVLSRLNTTAKSLVQLPVQESHARSNGRLVDEIFGTLFSKRDKGVTPPPPPSNDPWHIHLEHPKVIENDGLLTRHDCCTISLKEGFDRMNLSVVPKFYFLADVTGQREHKSGVETIPTCITLKGDLGHAIEQSLPSSDQMHFLVGPSEVLTIHLESKFRDHLSAHELDVTVTQEDQ